ncbi:TPA: hypothetical protein HA234_06855 [Candidatus Woesearchaeota archaeon]|nr:hypothetical protein [Candidatus Woesearchaeota archaeon]
MLRLLALKLELLLKLFNHEARPTFVALSTVLSPQLHPARRPVVAAVLIKLERVQFEGAQKQTVFGTLKNLSIFDGFITKSP